MLVQVNWSSFFLFFLHWVVVLVGTSERTGYTTLTTFTATARDEVSRRAVYLLRAMSYNEDCQAAKIETFLVEQGLQNLNFQDRVHRNYTVTMPEGYQCK